MQLREINIDGFGIFSKQQVMGLTSGLNVIYGENEAGKTTLIEFIRRMLFGMDRKSRGFNPYAPLNGGRHGGTLKCELASGEPVRISRNFDGKSDVRLTTSKSELNGQSSLDSVLGHATKTIFQNIFAFTLDELQTFDSLNDGEIKNRIYGAELGLGTVSLKGVEDSINKRAEAIFLPRGKKTRTNLLLNEIQEIEEEIQAIHKQSSEYDSLMRQLESCEKEQTALNEQIDSLKSLHALLSEKKILLSRLDDEETEYGQMKIDRDSLAVNHDLLAQESNVRYLQESTRTIQDSLKDKPNLENEKKLLEKQIEDDLVEIGSSWNEEKVLNFEFKRTQTNQVESFSKAFESLRQEMALAHERLETHQEQMAEERSKGFNIPVWIKTFCYGLTIGGLVGLIWSLVDMNIPLLVLSTVFMILGFISFWKVSRSKTEFVKEDLKLKTLEQRLQQARENHDLKTAEWRTWMREMSFDETLNPTGAREVINTIKEIQGKVLQKVELGNRIESMQKSLEEIAARINLIQKILPQISSQDDSLIGIEIIYRSFTEASKNQEKKNQIENQIQKKRLNIDKLKNQLKEKEDLLQPILHKVNTGEKAFCFPIQPASASEIEQKLNSISDRLKELEEEKKQLHVSIGETRNKLDRLTSNEELLVKQEALEIKKQNLRECTREWCRAKIALAMLDRARKQYEQTRQPDVVKAAGKIFSGITGGKYPRIIKLMDDDEVRIENKLGELKSVHEMSRGTREQLYLSMRLGLIEEYETRSEPLPIIMDDVLVNFDDNRKLNVIDMLKRFAQNRQIIVLTCHKTSLESYIKAGATRICV